jgi:hypothetical protein
MAKEKTIKKASVSTSAVFRNSSLYNLCMRTELPKVKSEKPDISRKDAFKKVVAH